jgi:hypothetical protein
MFIRTIDSFQLRLGQPRSDGGSLFSARPRVGMAWSVANLADELLFVVEPSRSQVQDGLGVDAVVPESLASFDTLVELLHP